jgi:hypothetical protein
MRLTIRSCTVGLAALAFAAAAPPASAAAHPLGDPQTVRLAAEGDQVTARWSAPPDDLLVLGSVTGVLADRREYVFDMGADGEPEPVGDTDADLLAASDEVADYLAANITVTQEGRACPAEVDLSGLVDDGAELVFTCDSPITVIDIAVTMLTDADPAYRTVAFAEAADREQQLYTADSPSAAWRFDTHAADGGNSAMLIVIGAVLVIVAATAFVALRRLRRAARS